MKSKYLFLKTYRFVLRVIIHHNLVLIFHHVGRRGRNKSIRANRDVSRNIIIRVRDLQQGLEGKSFTNAVHHHQLVLTLPSTLPRRRERAAAVAETKQSAPTERRTSAEVTRDFQQGLRKSFFRVVREGAGVGSSEDEIAP